MYYSLASLTDVCTRTLFELLPFDLEYFGEFICHVIYLYVCLRVCFVFCVWMGVILCLNVLKNNLVDKNIILFILCVWKRNKYEKLYILAKHYITKLFTYTYTSYNIAIYN